MLDWIAIIIILSVVIVLLEVILSASWNRFYFNYGVKVLNKEFDIIKTIDAAEIDLAALEDTFFRSWGNSLRFEQLSSTSIAFREEMFKSVISWYYPVMYGIVIIDNERKKLE